ncbi:FAD-dependent monooxygenase [Streptomyces sp. NPDC057638]|uniref:FAD-dependent monooxygenase n=1 Tax=Streptomyces sp. NPDC057638 TaxID=3346190 RepID=UPI0036B75951
MSDTDQADDARTDVLVVGAGPTGLLLAGDLAAAGLLVTLVERRPARVSNLTRSFGVHARTLEVLDARGLADDLIATGHPIYQNRLLGGLTLEVAHLPTRFPFVLITPQYEVERLLERRAREHGVRFLHGTRLTALRQDGGAGPLAPGHPVTAEVESADGARATLRARYAVGADGVRSTVRESLGLPFPGGSVIRSMILADVRLAEPPREVPATEAGAGSFALIVPFGDGWHRVMGWSAEHQRPDDAPVDIAELRDIVRDAFGGDLGMGEARWVSRFHCDERQVPSYRVGRIFLAGDAAHVHSPAGGQGLNTGIQDAANLSWKLAAVLRGEVSGDGADALLDSYHDERHPVGRAVLRSSGALIRAAMATSPLQRAARSLAIGTLTAVPALTRRSVRQISGIAVRYDRPRGSHPLTGRRAPDLALAEGRLYELLREGAFVLVTPEGTAAVDAPPAPGKVVRAHWRSGRATALLVRPDGYIAWARD